MKMANNRHISVGVLGEDIVAKYLTNRGFVILERNYRRQWGELDIVAKKDDVLHFLEVKATSRYYTDGEETSDRHRPEDHVDKHKRKRLGRVLRTWLLEYRVPENTEWTVDVVTVHIDTEAKKARVAVLENVLLD